MKVHGFPIRENPLGDARPHTWQKIASQLRPARQSVHPLKMDGIGGLKRACPLFSLIGKALQGKNFFIF
jgi:hypothetical protein